MNSFIYNLNQSFSSKISKPTYIPFIDGLRALSILYVFVNHLNPSFVPSGFLGVDIFFVISGFVITYSLAHRKFISASSFLIDFYKRRIIRLLPALFTFILTNSVLFYFLSSSTNPLVVYRTGLTAFFGLSNIYLYRQFTDYFAESSYLNPFTNTWSLGVEEQFYFIFPLLLLLSGFFVRSKNNFISLGTMLVLSTFSFIYFFTSSFADQPASFFLVTSRFWELSMGFFAYTLYSSKVVDKYSHRFLLLASFLFILFIPFLPFNLAYNPYYIFALVLSVFYILSVYSSIPNFYAYRYISFKPFLYLGLVSYSLYLWHWSVISLLTWIFPDHSFVFYILSIILTTLFTLLSFYFIEYRIGHSVAGFKLNIFLPLILAPFLVPFSFLPVNHRSFYKSRNTLNFLPTFTSRLSTFNFIFIGDSHSGHFATTLKNLSSQNHSFNYSIVSEPGTLFPYIIFTSPIGSRTLSDSIRRNDSIKAQLDNLPLTRSPRKNVFIISSFYSLYFPPDNFPFNSPGIQLKYYDSSLSPIPRDVAFNEWIENISIFAHSNPDSTVVLLDENPFFPNLLPHYLCNNRFSFIKRPDNCSSTIPKPISPFSSYFQKLSSLENVIYLDLYSVLCDNDICSTDSKSGRLYSDKDHLNNLGSTLVLERLFLLLSD